MAINYPVQTGGTLPATQTPSTALSNFNFNQFRQPVALPEYTDPNTIVQNSLEAMLNPNSSYIQNARQRGVEFAQQRGGINSSIAAGAAERAALEAAAPLAQQVVDIQQNRENAQTANWLADQNFSRELQGQLVSAPLNSSLNMLETLNQYALQDPQLYTPAVMSGFTNFFNRNMQDMFSRYFGTSS